MASESQQDEIDRHLEINHKDKYGFGGNTTIRIGVLDESDDEIIGRRCGRRGGYGRKITIRKDNVAGWTELVDHPYPYFPPSEEQLKEDYVNGRMSHEELEEKLEETLG